MRVVGEFGCQFQTQKVDDHRAQVEENIGRLPMRLPICVLLLR